MYRCRDCKTEYYNRVDFCECGNNTFDLVKSDERSQKPELTPEQKLALKGEIVSWVIFSVSIIVSILIWVFLCRRF